MKLAAATLAIGLAGVTQAWALPQCPATPRDITLSGTVTGWAYGGSVVSYDAQSPTPIVMSPCEEFWIDVQASSPDPNVNGTIYVDVYNSASPSQKILTKNWGLSWTTGTYSFSAPNAIPSADVGFPLAGTRDPRSLVKRIDVWSDYARAGSLAMSYTLTVHFRPRPGYNLGGLSYADAFGPLAHGTALHASMWAAEANYYRVSLQAGGTLTLSGSITNENWGLAAVVWITILDMSHTWKATPLNQSVPANSGHDPNGVTVTFTTPTFTNASAQTQDFYIVIESANSARVQDLTVNVFGDLIPPPQLTLFLDADNNFDTGNPSSDHLSYLPGKDPSSNASVSLASLPQAVKLIAAYVDNGQIVPPPAWASPITFSLSETSKFVGVAMNSTDQNTDDDFQLAATQATFSVINDGTLHSARVTLYCNDYGGFTTAAATDGVNTAEFRLPDDGATQNWLPSAGWYTSTGSVVDQGAASDDSDSSPTANGDSGDGLSAFEEFRGFIVMGNHVRTNPTFKDIFVYSEFTVEGLGNAWALPVAPHRISEAELGSDRRITRNYQNSGLGGNVPGHFVGTKIDGTTSEQLGIAVFDDQTVTTIPSSGSFAYGTTDAQKLTPSSPPVLGPPWTIGPNAARVYTIRIRKASPTSNSGSIEDIFDSAKLDQSIAHEIGHNLKMDDVGWSLACPPYADTVMVVDYFVPTTSGSSCAWNHIPYLYSMVDIGNLKVR